jgi:DNA-directed RNA polymerase specialized sigma24 family protein
MLAVAKAYVLAPGAAKQVVHDAWMAALAETVRFDGSAPLRAWLLRFVVRLAAPLATRPDGERPDTAKPAVDPDRLRGTHGAYPGHWRAYPRDWRTLPDDIRRGHRARRVVEAAVEALPVEQRAVITMPDVVGCPPREAYDIRRASTPRSDGSVRDRVSAFDCPRDLHAGVNVELSEHVADVGLDGLLAQEQLAGDLGVGLAVDDQHGDLELALGE